MQHRVLLAGIDGSGKSSCLELLVTRLEHRLRVARVVNHDGAIIIDGKQTRVLGVWYDALQKLRPVSIRFHLYGLFLAIKYLYKMAVVRRCDRWRGIDLGLYEIDLILHPAVYMTYHFPWTGRFRSRSRLALMRALFKGNGSASIFFLDTSPAVAIERIASRGKEVSPHENLQDLTALKREFENVVDAAMAEDYDITRIDTNTRTREEVVDEILNALSDKLESVTRESDLEFAASESKGFAR